MPNYYDTNKSYGRVLMTKLKERDMYIRELIGCTECPINSEIIYRAIEKLYNEKRIKFVIKLVFSKYIPGAEIIDEEIPSLFQESIKRYFQSLSLNTVYPTDMQILAQLKLTIEEDYSGGIQGMYPMISMTQYAIKPSKEDANRYREENKDILNKMNLPDDLGYEALNILVKFYNMSVDLSKVASEKIYSEPELEYIGYCLYFGGDIKIATDTIADIIPFRYNVISLQAEKIKDLYNEKDRLNQFIKEMHEQFFIE